MKKKTPIIVTPELQACWALKAQQALQAKLNSQARFRPEMCFPKCPATTGKKCRFECPYNNRRLSHAHT